jgi:hypothetical protein
VDANQALKPVAPEVRKRTHWALFLVIFVCAAPMFFSYLTYYLIKPEGRTNYGDLLDPRQYPMPELGATTLDGKPATLKEFAGKWVMLQADVAACAKPCVDKLYYQRQVRMTQGKDRDRIERVWLVLDDQPIDPSLLKEHQGTQILRVAPATLATWLPLAEGGALNDHIFIIDPLGNLMMRFPKDADPNKIKKDISKLLRASRIG